MYSKCFSVCFPVHPTTRYDRGAISSRPVHDVLSAHLQNILAQLVMHQMSGTALLVDQALLMLAFQYDANFIQQLWGNLQRAEASAYFASLY